MTREELHRNVKQFVYQTIMTFKNYSGEINETLVGQIVQSATRMSAHCRNICETKNETAAQSGLFKCNDFLEEIIYLLNILDHTKTQDEIKTENIIMQAVELKQIVTKLCDNTLELIED